ncbi:VCBS domain-containing protein [Vibrio sp. TRT 1302]|uniref:VCBS domain-containing protein n=1 Tax=Vibrio sp. TRT 1302 TaxID=3418504 RepID=UPI003CF06FD5
MGFGTYVAVGNLAANQIIVIDANGNVRVLAEGELPKPGEVIVQGNPEFAEDQQLQVNLVGDNGENQDISAEIADIFAALEEGQDPTELGEDFATAAGGQSGSSLTSSASVSRDAAETIASTNFDTSGFESLGLSQTQSLALLEQFRLFNPVFVDLNNDPLGDSLAVVTDEDTPISGTLTATDQNAQDILTFSQSSAPSNGTAVVNPDGTWTYTPNENYNGPDSFTVIVNDGNGGTDTLVVNIDVTPVNDPATVSDDAGLVVEDSENQTVATGTLDIVDVDAGEAFVQAFESTNEYGTFKVEADGSWSFTINNESPAVQALPDGKEIPLSFDVTSLDGTGTGTVSITVKGTNDTATISVKDAQSKDVIEAGIDKDGNAIGNDFAEGKLSVSDADAGQSIFGKVTPEALQGEYGTFTFDSDTGAWTYQLDDKKADALKQGETFTETLTVASVDGTDSHKIEVEVKGSNDAPTVEGSLTKRTNEDAKQKQLDLLDGADDVDKDAQLSIDLDSMKGLVKGLSIADDGHTLIINPEDFSYLTQGEKAVIKLEYNVIDGLGGVTAQTAKIVIKGRDDDAEISVENEQSADIIEAGIDSQGDAIGNDFAEGKLSVSDADAGQSIFGKVTPEALQGEYGTFTFDSDTGAWTYQLDDKKADALKQGETFTETLTVASVDGTDSHKIEVEVKGSNDAPTVEGSLTKRTNEDAKQKQLDLLDGADDVDKDAQLSIDLDSMKGLVKGLSIADDGHTLIINPEDFSYLTQGEKAVIKLEYNVIDGLGGVTAQTAKIVIKGRDDDAEISVENEQSADIIEAGIDSQGDAIGNDFAKGTLKVEDADSGQDTFAAVDGAKLSGKYGDFTFNASTGEWTYTLDDTKANKLDHNDTYEEKLTVKSLDGSASHTISVEVQGSNDAPTVVGALSKSTHENAAKTTLDLLKGADDVDEDATLSIKNISGLVDGLTLDADGHTLNIDPSFFDYLSVGETETLVLSYNVVDGLGGITPQTATITITGTNDGPEANDDKYGVETTTLLFSESFEHMANTGKWTVVHGDQLDDWDGTNGLEIQRDGLIAKATDGDYIAELDAHQNTAITTTIDTAGQDRIRVEFDYNPRKDGNESSNMTFTVGSTVITVNADGMLSNVPPGVVVSITPADNGWFRVSGEFDVNDSATTLLGFAGDGTSDSYGALLDNIKVTGINQPNLVTEEEQTITISFDELLANDIDIDGDDLIIVEGSISLPKHGEDYVEYKDFIVDYENGTITFTPAKDFNGEVTFTYKVTDGNGGFDDATVTLNVTPVNDAPEFTNENGVNGGYEFSYDEGIDGTTVIGTVTAEDIDNTQDQLSFRFKSGNEQGWFEIDDQGRITLTDAGVESLANDFDVTANIHNLVVTVSDGTDSVDTIVKLMENNLNDEDTKFDSDKVSFNYQENHEPNVTIGTVTATDKDGDNISYSIAEGDNVYIDGKPLYQVDAKTGEISLTEEGAAAFTNDYEIATNTHVIKVTAKGFDGAGDPTVGTVEVTLNETDDETDNKPQAKDFTVSLDAQGKSDVLFDSSDESTDQISDKEDDRDGEQLSVVITELPDSGKLYYIEGDNKTEVVVGQKYANPNNIVYEDDQESTGFFLGLNDTSNLEKGKESTTDFHNWGERVSATERVVEFANGDKVTITSETRDGAPGKPLVQDNAQLGHMGFGISAGKDQGIDSDEVIRINFESRPADSVTLGLSGLGGWFAPNAADNVISRAEITVTFDYGDRTEQETFFYDDTHNNQTVTIVAPEGAEIVAVEASTKGPGNWELTSLEAKASDSFDYKAVDSDGNESDVKTVTIVEGNTAPFANDDPDGYSISLGSLNNNDWSGYESVVSAHYQGSDKAVNISMDGDLKMGVDSDANGGPGAQIQYNRDTGVSEQLVFNLGKPSTEFSFTVSNLIKGEGGPGNHEQGKWVAYFGDTAVASGMFIANDANNTGSYSFDANGEFAFDKVVFEAVDFTDVPAKGTDSSDYFVTGFSASSDGGAHVIEQDPDGTTEFRIPVSELLSNDGDVDGDEIRITYVFGEQNGDAYIDGDEVVFNLERDHVGPAEFKYQITDDKGGFAEATVKVIVNPVEPNDVTVKSIEGTDALEGDNLVYKVTLSEGPLSAQSFKLTYGGANDSADKQADVDLSKVVFTNGVKFENGQITVPVGVSSFSILVPALKDGTYENPETFSITLGEGSSAVSESATISNIDIPGLKVKPAGDVSEGSNAVFEVELTKDTEVSVKINLGLTAESDGATLSGDGVDVGTIKVEYYNPETKKIETLDVADNGDVIVPKGVTELTVTVPTLDDKQAPVFEGEEAFNLVVKGVEGVSSEQVSGEAVIVDDGREIGGDTGSPTNSDDDRPVVESVSEPTIEEAVGAAAEFEVELSAKSETETTVTMKLTELEATFSEDFNGDQVKVVYDQDKAPLVVDKINGEFTFTLPAGYDSFKVQVEIKDDSVSDNNEQFKLTVSTEYQDVAESGKATITDNERPSVDLNGVQYQVEMVSESAEFSNVFGYYIWDDATKSAELKVLIHNSHDVDNPDELALLDSLDNVEYFILPNGASSIDAADVLTVNAEGKLLVNGNESSQAAYFSHIDTEQFDISDDKSEVRVAMEDLLYDGSDKDFNDLVIAIRPVDGGIDYSTTYVEGQGAVAIADVDADIFDDHNLITSMSVKLTNVQSGDVVDYSRIGANFLVDNTSPDLLVITVFGGGALSASDFETALKAITFSNTNADPDNTDRVIEVTVADDKGQASATAKATVVVQDAPDSQNNTPPKAFGDAFDTVGGSREIKFDSLVLDAEDDLDENDVIRLVIESEPKFGDIYYFNEDGVRTELSVGDIISETTSIHYSVNPELIAVNGTIVAKDIDSSLLGTSSLTVNGLYTISGGTVLKGDIAESHQFTETGKLIYDHAKGEEGLAISTTKNDAGNGDEINRNEYISVKFESVEVNKAVVSLGSINGLFNNDKSSLTALFFKDGKFVGSDELDIVRGEHNKEGSAQLQNGVAFDEVRFVLNAKNNSAGYVLQGIKVVEVTDVADSFDYKAVDSEGLESDSATITLNSSNLTISSNPNAIDHVRINHYGDQVHEHVSWSASGISNPISNKVLEGHKQGLFVDVGDAGDSVYLGEGNDTIYLGRSHAGLDEHEGQGDLVSGTQQTLVNIFSSGADGKHLEASDDKFVDGVEYVELTTAEENSDLNINSLSTANIDIAHGGGGDDIIFGEGGIDAIFGGSGDDQIYGGAGVDVLRGGTGNDYIDGGEGKDYLIGGSGDDILIGGDDADIFKFVDQGTGVRDGEVDTIKDFTAHEDKIDISELLHTDANDSITTLLDNHEIGLALNGDNLELTISDGAKSQTVIIEGGKAEYTEELAGGPLDSASTTAILNDLLKVYDTTNH